jgi:hypothetical protein
MNEKKDYSFLLTITIILATSGGMALWVYTDLTATTAPQVQEQQ